MIAFLVIIIFVIFLIFIWLCSRSGNDIVGTNPQLGSTELPTLGIDPENGFFDIPGRPGYNYILNFPTANVQYSLGVRTEGYASNGQFQITMGGSQPSSRLNIVTGVYKGNNYGIFYNPNLSLSLQSANTSIFTWLPSTPTQTIEPVYQCVSNC